MRTRRYFTLFVKMHLIILSLALTVAANEEISKRAPEDPLPSWNEGRTKAAIISFVENTTNESHPEYVAPNDRIATFDNDGTLWCEFPDYVPFLFMLDRIKVMAPRQRTREILQQIRQMAAEGRIRLPLKDSPKCNRCSMAGICLPDEVNLYLSRRC